MKGADWAHKLLGFCLFVGLMVANVAFFWNFDDGGKGAGAKSASAKEATWSAFEEKIDKYEGFVSMDRTKFWLTKVYCDCWNADHQARDCKNTSLVIPETIQGYKVTKIGLKRTNYQSYDSYLYPNFVFCDLVKMVVLPNTVTELGYDCFLGLEYLEEVRLSTKLKEIPTGTFYECRVKKVNMHEGLKRIGDYAFAGSSVQKALLPSTLQKIGRGAFEYCPNLREITIPDGVNMGNLAFHSCYNLERVRFGERIKLAGGGFNNCIALSDVQMDGGSGFVYRDETFFSKKKDRILSVVDVEGTYKIPNGVKAISPYAFYHLRKLDRVVFPKSLKEIGKYAFFGVSLQQMKLKGGLEKLGKNCLGTANYKKLDIPASVRKISENGLLQMGYGIGEVKCNVAKKNKTYYSKKGALFHKKTKQNIPITSKRIQ